MLTHTPGRWGNNLKVQLLTHWGRVTHICVGDLTIIGSDNGLSPGQRQAIIWTNVGILSIGPPVTNFSEILMKILSFSFKKMRLKVSSAKRRPFCLSLNVLNSLYWAVPWALIVTMLSGQCHRLSLMRSQILKKDKTTLLQKKGMELSV